MLQTLPGPALAVAALPPEAPAVELELLQPPALVAPRSCGPRFAALALPPLPSAVRRARQLVLDACWQWGLLDRADEAALVASELVTNAVLHAGTHFQLHLHHVGRLLHVAVHDRGGDFCPSWWDEPAPGGPGGPGGRGDREGHDGPAEGQYGLAAVRALSAAFGGYRHPAGGTVMWAALATSRPGDERLAVEGTASRLRGSDAGAEADAEADAEGGAAWGARAAGRGHSGAVRAGSAVRRTVVVNAVRRTSADRRSRPRHAPWRLDLELGWDPAAPQCVDLTLHARPPHPALPSGRWRTSPDVLRGGLTAPAGDSEVRTAPAPTGHTVLVELHADPPQVLQLPSRSVRDFLSAAGL